MKVLPSVLAALLVCFLSSMAQTGTGAQHFAKDGLSFDYPAGWQLNDQSTAQMQLIQLLRGDVEIRVRVPREPLKTPQKEAEAKKLFQDKYVDQFVESLQQAGLRPNRTEATTEIGGGPAAGINIRAILDREPGGMDSYYRVLSDHLVHLSQIGSQSDLTKSLDAWDMVRKSIKIEAPAQPAASATPNKP